MHPQMPSLGKGGEILLGVASQGAFLEASLMTLCNMNGNKNLHVNKCEMCVKSVNGSGH